ncbi:TonB-dependent receptor [Chitinophaga lutea]|uniref:TonB-dependent receptor n=1 Tax=Chitinophaga lutea TaxID=2488634 RepID=A0A3N4PWL1_9BACT|nr:TonB-dependent receptor [Chitinophaga lutea]
MKMFVLRSIFTAFGAVTFALVQAQSTGAAQAETAVDTLRPDSTPRLHVLYQRQARSRLVQSAASIGNEELLKSPTSSFRNALSGRLAGLYTLQTSGEPNSDLPSTSLRGMDPLILIDGIPRGITSIDPEEIESITVLKDALATAMLGMRGSNGALLVTTKKGIPGRRRISFTAQTGVQQTGKMRQPLNAYDYARLYNEALENDGKAPVYTQADLDAYKNGSDPVAHPDVNWMDQAIKDQSQFSRFNLNVDGGNNIARYFVSLDYMNQDGFLKTTGENSYNTGSNLKRYIFRSNVEVNLNKYLTTSLNLFGRIIQENQPGATTANVLTALGNTPSNAYAMLNPNGSLGGNQVYQNNIFGQLNRSGYRQGYSRQAFADFAIKRRLDDVVPGLWAKALISFSSVFDQDINRSKTFKVYNWQGGTNYQEFGTSADQVNSTSIASQSRQFYTEGTIGYEKQLGAHHLDVLLLGSKDNVMNSNDLPRNSYQFTSRIAYNYDGRYLLELSGGYSGSEIYAPGSRFGFFPAAGIGWNIAREPFMAGLAWLGELKLRTSYGRTGNANGGYFAYKQYYANGLAGYTFGTSPSSTADGVAQTVMANPGITWEKADKFNAAIDIALFNDRLTFTAEYYNNRYFDLLQQRGRNSAIMGESFPNENIGIRRYKGVELTATYNGQAGAVHFYASGNLTVQQSRILYQDEVVRPYEWMKRTGLPVGQSFGYIANGLFQTQAELNGAATVPGYTPRLGDIRYLDLNGDGVLNQYDEAPIGTQKPLVFGGLTAGAQFKGFDVSILLQGTKHRNLLITGDAEWEFRNDGTGNAYQHHLNRWSATGKTADAAYPRLTVGNNINNHVTSSYWMHSGDYLRIKNLEVGYSLPEKWLKRIHLASVRCYVNAINLATWASFDRYDPESGAGLYPVQKMMSAGINIKL